MDLNLAILPYKPILGIITVSTSRVEAKLKGIVKEDESGNWMESVFKKNGFKKILRLLVRDDESQIINAIMKLWYNGAELIIITGGSGPSPSDVSYHTVKSILDEELISYSSLFNLISFREVKTKIIASRLIAGFYKDVLVFLVPGSVNAVKTAVNEIILNEYEHLLWLRKFGKV